MTARFKWWLALTALTLVTFCVGARLAATHLNKRHWDHVAMSILVNLHRSWRKDGQPNSYEVQRYYSGDGFVRCEVDTNQYSADHGKVGGLFRAEYFLGDKPIIFVIDRDGRIFRQQKGGHLKEVNSN